MLAVDEAAHSDRAQVRDQEFDDSRAILRGPETPERDLTFEPSARLGAVAAAGNGAQCVACVQTAQMHGTFRPSRLAKDM